MSGTPLLHWLMMLPALLLLALLLLLLALLLRGLEVGVALMRGVAPLSRRELRTGDSSATAGEPPAAPASDGERPTRECIPSIA